MYILFSLKVWLTTPCSTAFAWSSWHIKTNSKLIQFNLLLNYETSLGTNTNLPKELSIFNVTTLSVSATFFRTTEMPVSRPMIPKAVGQTPLSNLKLYHLLFLPVKKKMDTLHFQSCTRWATHFGNSFWGLELFIENCFIFSRLMTSLSGVEIPQKAREPGDETLVY